MERIETFILCDNPEPVPPALVCGGAFGTDPAWDAIEAAVEAISAHYGMDSATVWGAVIDLELEMSEHTGMDAFGRLLERPWGYSLLASCVAESVLGEQLAGELSAPIFSYH